MLNKCRGFLIRQEKSYQNFVCYSFFLNLNFGLVIELIY